MDDSEPTEIMVFVICCQRMEGAPPPPFVVEVKLTNAQYWLTEYGPIHKAACSTQSYLTADAADKQLQAFRKIINESYNLLEISENE